MDKNNAGTIVVAAGVVVLAAFLAFRPSSGAGASGGAGAKGASDGGADAGKTIATVPDVDDATADAFVFAAAPADSFLIATLDVEKVRASPFFPIAAPFLAGLGGDRVAATCGLRPEDHAIAIGLSIPNENERNDFGAAFATDLPKDALAPCIEGIIKDRGGRPAKTAAGPYDVVADEAALGLAGTPSFAVKDGGLLVGKGDWLAAMMAASANAGAPTATGLHADLRKSIKAGSAIAVTVILPKELRDRLRAEMEAERADAGPVKKGAKNAGARPGSADGGTTMLGILGVSAVAMGIDPGTSGGIATIDAEGRCETADECETVRAFVVRRRDELARDPMLRLVGIGPLADSLTAVTEGPRLHVHAEIAADVAAGLLSRFLPGRAPTGQPAPRHP